MEDYQVSKNEWSTLDIARLVADGVKTITVENEHCFLNLPIDFFSESGSSALQNSITQDSLSAILSRFENVHRIQTEFTGFQLPAKTYVKIKKAANEADDDLNGTAWSFGDKEEDSEDEAWLQGKEIALELSIRHPTQLLNLINFNDREQDTNIISLVAHEFGHIFKDRATKEPHSISFGEAWADLLGHYTCEQLNIPFRSSRHELSAKDIINHKTIGHYASVEIPYSSHARAMLMEIKDASGGWDIYRNFFREIIQKPFPQNSTSEMRWLWMRDLIKEKSAIDIAPILQKYHLPLPDGTVEIPRITIQSEGHENLITAGTASSAPRDYSLIGNDGHTTFYGSPHNDKYYGGFGEDVLQFLGSKRGQDTFFNFDPSKDRIIFSFSQGEAPTAVQVGNDFVFSFSNGDSLTLADTKLSELKKENFIFRETAEEDLAYGSHGFYPLPSKYHNLSATKLWYLTEFSSEGRLPIPVPTLSFEHTMSCARQSGVCVTFDFDEGDVLAITDFKKPSGINLSDFKETDFRYTQSSIIDVNIGIDHEGSSSPQQPFEAEDFCEDAMGFFSLIEEWI